MPFRKQNMKGQKQPAVCKKDCLDYKGSTMKNPNESKLIKLAPKKETLKVIHYFTHIHRGQGYTNLETIMVLCLAFPNTLS